MYEATANYGDSCCMIYSGMDDINQSNRINTLRLRQNGRHFPGDIFKCIFLSENVRIVIKISLKFVPKGPINNIPTLA